MVLILKELAGFGGYWVHIYLGFIADVVFGVSGKLFANLLAITTSIKRILPNLFVIVVGMKIRYYPLHWR